MHSKAVQLRRSDYGLNKPETCSSKLYSRFAEYRLVAKKGEGTFSEVLKAQCIKNSKYVAIKCMKNHFDSLEQVITPGSPDFQP